MTSQTMKDIRRIISLWNVVPYVLVLVVAGSLLTGCGGRPTDKTRSRGAVGAGEVTMQPVGKDARQPAICVITIDGTRSYQFLERAKQTAAAVIRALPGASKVFVRWITEDSESDRCAIVSVLLPPDPIKPKNPYAKHLRERYHQQQDHNRQIRERMIAHMVQATSPNAGRTDVWGTLLAAAERFDNSPSLRPMVILLTDMVDNVGKRPTRLTLSGMTVQIMGFQVDGGTAERKAWWIERLTERGAVSVTFTHLDEVFIVAQ